MIYTVRPGDTLFAIAQRYQTSVERLRQINQLTTDQLKPGQVLQVKVEEKSLDTIRHRVVAGESLYSIARKYGLSVTELKQLNPLASSNLRIGQELTVKNAATSGSETIFYHTVAPGETLSSIAERYQLTVSELVKLNGLLSHNLKSGQTLKIREIGEALATSSEQYVVVAGDTLYGLSQRFGVSVEDLRLANQLTQDALQIGQTLEIPPRRPPLSTPTPAFKDALVHIVKSGESLYALARMYGLSVQEIRQANALDSEILHIGQQILIPEKNQAAVNPVSPLPTSPAPVVLPSPPPPTHLPELPWDLKSVLEARRIIHLEANSGYEIMGGGLRGAVGRNRVNRAEDLQKVQQRLVQLNMLKHNHGESPEAIIQKIGGKGALTANYIPLTIQAIERMQEQFKIRFWIEHTTRVAMMKTNSYTQGVVVPGDVTEKFMNEYTEYRLSFPHPHGGQTVSVRFHNFPRSAHTQYYHGVSYAGISNPDIPMEVFRRLGANETLAEALSFVSQHEGKFDAINSYDRAIFSFGFIQFAGNGGGLVPLLAAIKQKAPKVFEEYFQQFGLDVEYREHLGQIQQAELRVANPHDRGGKFILRGQEAERVLRADKVLHGVFIRAGHYLPVVTLQIDAALQHYVKPALQLSLNLVLGTLRLSNATLTDYINSAMGLTMLIDLSINRWINTARQVFQEAIEKVAWREKIFTQEALRQIDERLVVAQIIADAQQKRDDLLVKRASNIYNSRLSTHKSPGAAVIRPS